MRRRDDDFAQAFHEVMELSSHSLLLHTAATKRHVHISKTHHCKIISPLHTSMVSAICAYFFLGKKS